MEIKYFLLLMWKNARILIAGALLGAALGFGAARIQTPVYEAKTQILISRSRQQTNTDMLPLGEDQLVTTNIQLAKSQPVLEAVSSLLGSNVLADQIQVSAIPNTLIIQIKAQDSDPRQAASIANTLVQVLIQQNEELVAARYVEFESNLNTQIDQIQKQIDSLQSQISQINQESISEQLEQVNREIENLQSEITSLETEINNYPALLNDKQRATLNLQESQLDQLRSRLNLYQQIQTNLTFIGKPGQTGVSRDDPRLSNLQSTLNIYQQLYLSLVDSRETINLDRMQNTPKITQIDPAQPPKTPVRPLPVLYVLLGTVVGFVLAVTAILMMDHFDETLRSPQKVQEILGVPIIGNISDAQRSHVGNGQSSPPGREDPTLVNAFGTLRINVNRLMQQRSVKSVLISSPARGDGKTTVAMNLAAAFARAGKKTILIDADLYHPQVNKRLKLVDTGGLTSILSDGTDWEAVKQESKGVTVIPGGRPTTFSAGLLESDEMINLLSSLEQKFDVVIVDGPPLFIMDAQILASRVGGILMVIRQGDTLTAVARAMLDQLNLMEVNVFGAILNCVPQKQSYYFDERIEHIGKKEINHSERANPDSEKKGGPPKEANKLDETSTLAQ